MNNKSNLLGVVLCGGESKRMGKDKGLLEVNGKKWAEHTADKLRAQNLPVIISINNNQQEAYGEIFKKEELVVDELPMHGPLNGLLTVNSKFKEKDILLLACDLIEMESSTLTELIATYQKHQADYFAYEENNFFQPLCAIYTAKALSLLSANLKSGSLPNYSFQHILNNARTCRIQAPSKKSFTNFNSGTVA
jgi:molybdopterin-guanine dinucleotide biosynthesis protein A